MSDQTTLTPLVSVIMPVRNEGDFIARSLESVLRQDYPAARMQLLMADGMSTDGTREILERLAAKDERISIIDNPVRVASTGLNVAIRNARGEIVLRMDAHTEYAKDYVRTCVAVLQETRADNVGGPARTRATAYLERAVAAAYHSRFSVGGARFHQEEFEGPVDTVPYGCWHRTAFERFGLFDEELVRNQDDEHNLRICRGQGKVWQSSRIRSWYRPRGSLASLFRQYMQYGYWKVRVIQKHRLPASIRHLVPGVFMAMLLLLTCAAPFSRFLGWAWLALVGAYGLCLLGASALTAHRRGWALFPVLPAVFACYHLGYGYGFLRGLWDFGFRSKRPDGAFTSLTRATVVNKP